MVIQQFRGLSLRCRPKSILFSITFVLGTLTAHCFIARAYYSLNSQGLGLVASMAVRMGAKYLPANPRAAIQIADADARDNGIAPAEIVFTESSSDNKVLTIRLDRKVPQYVALLAVGLPARDIDVTASAHVHDELRRAPQGTRSAGIEVFRLPMLDEPCRLRVCSPSRDA
jgi:hypothetical protein